MSDEKTNELNEPRSFEERVFQRFDAMDGRFDAMGTRFERIETRLDSLDSGVEKLEAKQYDTKPIWERALAAIADTNVRMEQGFEQLRIELRTDFQTGIDGLRTEWKSEFSSLQSEMDHSLHGVGRKIDVLNQNIFQVQADQRYVDRRLQEIESETKPT